MATASVRLGSHFTMFATTFWSGGAPIRIVPCGQGPVEVIAAYKAITGQIPAPLTTCLGTVSAAICLRPFSIAAAR